MEASLEQRFYNSELRIYNNRVKRNRELKRHITILAFAVILLLTLVIVFLASKTVAQASDSAQLAKYFLSVEIKPGDTLTSLAHEYTFEGKNDVKSFIDEVCFINNIADSDKLVSGNYIVVPYYTVAPAK